MCYLYHNGNDENVRVLSIRLRNIRATEVFKEKGWTSTHEGWW